MKHQIIRNTALVLSPFLLYVVIDDFYRVQNEEEFIEKLNMSDNEHIDYIRKNQQACLSEDDVSGQKLNDRLYNELGIERDIKNKKRNLWKTSKKASLDFFT